MKGMVSVVFIVVLFLGPFYCYALEPSTHELINQYISKGTFQGFSLDQYLRDELKIQGGVEEVFVDSSESMSVSKWLRAGGKREDLPPGVFPPYVRSMNHFHNPLTDQGFGTGESSLFWAQKGIGTQSPGGYYSWNDVRDFFYKALTLSTKTERDTYFAKMFRGLGQLMHLVHDLSVPEHARNQFHPISKYEKWVQKDEKNIIANVIPFPLYFNEYKIGNLPALGSIPIGNLFDTNQYKNPNPDPNVTLRDDIGLSEYTNANFLSPLTIFKTDEFPYPSWDSVVENPETDPITGKKRTYLKKQAGYGETIDHLIVGRHWYKYLPSSIWDLAITFDDKVLKNYADKLLPRAVGYSAGLLKYFFRGKLNVIPTGPGRIQIQNLSSEAMSGAFTLYYDANDGTRKLLSSWQLTIGSGGTSNPVTFSEPSDSDEPGKYILVFKGQMGNEPNPVAVAGKVWSVKYYWAIVVDFPPWEGTRYTEIFTGIVPGSETECGSFTGVENGGNRIDNCPGSGNINVYLIASEQPLNNNRVYRGCTGNLRSLYIGQFSKSELFSKIYGQIYKYETVVRQIADTGYGNFICRLGNGTMAYGLESYGVNQPLTGQNLLSLSEIPVDSPEVIDIKNSLFGGLNLAAAFKSNDFKQGDYGSTMYTGAYTLPFTCIFNAGWCGFFKRVSQTDSTSVWDASSAYPPTLVYFDVVGTIPGENYSDKYIAIRIPDISLDYTPF